MTAQLRINAGMISEWYATRSKLGGSDRLTDRQQRLLMLAHHHHHGIAGSGRLTVAAVREFIAWAAVHGSTAEKEAVST